MSDATKVALEVIDRQVKELDGILSQAQTDLNTVAAKERVAKWKAKTIPLLSEHVGSKESQQLSGVHPGPSFTYDLLEELSDEVEAYRTCLAAIAKQLKIQEGSEAG